MGRAISISQLYAKKRDLVMLDGELGECIGSPELKGCWMVWGNPSNGKTNFVLQLCKILTEHSKVAYNSMEEGDSESLRKACARTGMEDVRHRFFILDNEPIDELKERLRKHKAPNVVVIDSIQYSNLNYKEYVKLRNEFREVLFIIISHAEGREPADRRAKSIRYDASVKIFVEGFVAFISSRYADGGVSEYVIFEEEANKYHLNNL